jgi:hypothetical protein
VGQQSGKRGTTERRQRDKRDNLGTSGTIEGKRGTTERRQRDRRDKRDNLGTSGTIEGQERDRRQKRRVEQGQGEAGGRRGELRSHFFLGTQDDWKVREWDSKQGIIFVELPTEVFLF